MPSKKKHVRNPARRQNVNSTRQTNFSESRDSALGRRLNDLSEQIDIMVPEITARIAALEHLLLDKHLCTREDLVRSREFVRMLEN